MKKLVLAAVMAATVAAGSANAQSASGVYAGVGGNWVQPSGAKASDTRAAGVFAGYDFNKYLSAEFDLDAGFANGNQRASTSTTINGIAGIPVAVNGLKLKPYALVGTGYDFTYANHSNTIQTAPIWNVGGGLMYDVNDRVGLDLRYTYVDGYNKGTPSANAVGVNVSYKF